MNRKYPIDLKLYDTVYGNEFPEEQYYMILFDEFPSKHCSNVIYDESIYKILKEQGFVEEMRVLSNRSNQENYMQLMVNHEKSIIIKIIYKSRDNIKNIYLDILYNVKYGEITSQLNFKILDNVVKKKERHSNIHLVKSEMGTLDTEEYTLDVKDIDIELHYGSEFLKTHTKIVERLKKNRDKGIILLHGVAGSGKTNYLKYLTKLVTNKDILFIPPSMAESLSEPAIIPFLMEKKNSILIIEDAEKVIGDRETNGSAAGVSNILNLTDGILGDCLNIQIIATFNMRREKIDTALLRKGRLIAEHKFDALPVNDTNRLLKYLNKNYTSDKPLTLAEIYNIDEDEIRITKQSPKIGF